MGFDQGQALALQIAAAICSARSPAFISPSSRVLKRYTHAVAEHAWMGSR